MDTLPNEYTKKDDYLSCCDRCLKYYNPRGGGFIVVKDGAKFSRKLELCPKCLKAINEIVFIPKRA